MTAARQLCRGSNTLAADARPRETCPHCGRKVVVSDWVWIAAYGKREKRPVIPAHARDEHGEMRVQMDKDKNRYPRPVKS